METEAIVQALRTVPEAKLAIIRLVWELLNENGDLDMKKVTFHRAEVDEALREAHLYNDDVGNTIRWLASLKPRS